MLRRISLLLTLLGALAACSAGRATPPLAINPLAPASCFGNASFNPTDPRDVRTVAIGAQSEVGGVIHLPATLPAYESQGTTRSGLIEADNGGMPGFAVEFVANGDDSPQVTLLYSNLPRCVVAADSLRLDHAQIEGRDISLGWQGTWDTRVVEGIRGIFRSADLYIELTLVWPRLFAPPEAERRDALLDWATRILAAEHA